MDPQDLPEPLPEQMYLPVLSGSPQQVPAIYP